VNPVLIAGVGNIFHGDDGFGVRVAERLAECELPAGVDVRDFGIRGLDLAYALTGGYRLVVIVDTVQRGEAHGTLYVIEPEMAKDDARDGGALSPHEMDPARVLRLARLLGGECAQVLLVGCEPATFGDPEEGLIGLSREVEKAVDPATAMATRLAADWLKRTPAAAGNALEERIQ